MFDIYSGRISYYMTKIIVPNKHYGYKVYLLIYLIPTLCQRTGFNWMIMWNGLGCVSLAAISLEI